MKYLEPILVFALIVSIGVFVYCKETSKDNTKTQIKEVVRLETKVRHVRDTITRVEIRLKKAKALHDTVTILKEQDTLIKFLKIETIMQDTIIKKQDTIIIDCESLLKKQKRKSKLGFGLGFAAGFATGIATEAIIKK